MSGVTGTTTTRPTSSTQQPQSSSNAGTHTVKKGESLWTIAQQHKVDHQELIRANPQLKNPDLIHPGQEINLPQQRAQGTQATGGPGGDGRSSYEPSSSAPPPQIAANPNAPASTVQGDPQLSQEVRERRQATHTGPRGRRGTTGPSDEEESQTQATLDASATTTPGDGADGGATTTPSSTTTAPEQKPSRLHARPELGERLMPNANLSGDNRRVGGEAQYDVESGTRRTTTERQHTENRGADQSTDLNRETRETTRDGNRTTSLEEDNRVRNRVTGESSNERTIVAGDNRGNTGSRTTNHDTPPDIDARNRRRRIAGENGSDIVTGTAVLGETTLATSNGYQGVATHDRSMRTDDTGAGYEAHALAAKGDVVGAATVDMRRGEVNVGIAASGQADLVGVSGRAQVGSTRSAAGAGFAEGEAHVGARAEGAAGVTLSPSNVGVRVGAEGFAGAEVKGTLGYESRYGGVSATARGQAGIGGAAGLDVGYRNGSLRARADLGAAIGLGGRVTVDVNVNVANIASDAWEGTKNAGRSVARFFGF